MKYMDVHQAHTLAWMVEEVNADPQGVGYTLTRDGEPAAVLIDYGEFNRLLDMAAIQAFR